ncbi:hypothetical protein BH10BAC4_BH10BAC4_10570 [soil metagenome]
MKIFLTNQEKNLDTHLHELMSCKVMEFDRNKLTAKTSIEQLTTRKSLNEIDLNFFFNYFIFPSNVMVHKTQWAIENRSMRIGDTIVQQVFIPPLKEISQKIIFGVRINSIIREPRRVGFSYETLEGHVERGESTFTIEEEEGQLLFKIRTFSKPATFLTRLLGPVFSVPYQAYCTRKALQNVKSRISIG